MAKNSSHIPRLRIGLNVLIQAVLALVLFGIANYLGFQYYKRWDFSRDGKYTLSNQTQRVIGNLKKPVRFIVFFSGASPVAKDTINLLKEYGYASKKMIDVEVVDPFLAMTRAREVATKYKLRDNDNVVIIDTDGRSKFVNAAAMAEFEPAMNLVDKPHVRNFKGEAVITSALIELTEPDVNLIYCVSGHGETALDTDPAVNGLRQFIERQNVKVKPLSLAGIDAVPDNAKALYIIAPKYDFDPSEISLLKTFWNEKHGRIFVALNPGSSTPRLAVFLAEMGLTINEDRILRTYPVKLAGGIFRGILKEVTGDFVPGSPITKRLTNASARLFGGLAQSIALNKDQADSVGIKLQPLIKAADGYWGETQYNAEAVYFDPKEDHINPLVAASAEKGTPDDIRIHVDASSRLVAIGSSGFLTNEQITESDMDFILSSLNWLLDREELIGITPKPVRNLALNLTESQLGTIALSTMAAIPGFAAILGLIVWLKRRR